MPTDRTMTNAAADAIAAICSTPGLTDSVADLFRVGRVADRIQTVQADRPDLAGTPPADQRAVAMAWNAEVIVVHISDNELVSVKKAMDKAVAKGLAGGGRVMTEVLTLLGFSAED